MKKTYLLSLILLSIFSFSQETINIAFGETINLGKVEQTTIFEISSTNKNFMISGEKINDFVFEQPNIYQIKVIEKEIIGEHDCNHNHLPNNIVVNVADSKIVINPESVKFSKPIRKNKDCSGIYLTLKAKVISIDKKPIKMNLANVFVAGIGSNIIAKVDKKYQILKNGTQEIVYQLSGMVTENAFLMFDFVQPNGTVQTISLLQPVAN